MYTVTMVESGISLSSLIDDSIKNKLATITSNEQVVPDRGPRQSKKDAPYVAVLKDNPTLTEDINSTMQRLIEKGIPMPVIHITAEKMRLADGTEVSTGYRESIDTQGFRPRDTNVAAFVERGNSVHLANPQYFLRHPYKLLRNIAEVVEHYKHHGSRTNKASLGENREQGRGLPAMMIIDSRGVQLLKGTDYDDHFILHNPVPATNILGSISLDGRNTHNTQDLKAITEEFLESIGNQEKQS